MKPKKKIALIGARVDGQSAVVVNALSYIDSVEVIGYFDDTDELQSKEINGYKVLGKVNELFENYLEKVDYLHVCIGNNEDRCDLYYKFKEFFKAYTVIHPSSIISDSATIASGCYIGPGSIINNNVKIDEYTIINTGVILEHDNIVGRGVHIAPGVVTAGRVIIGDKAFIGIGSRIIPDIIIDKGAFVKAGSIITKNINKA